MVESMVSIVVAVVLIVTGIMIVAHHRREYHGQRPLSRLDGQRLWDRMRHRH